jgi:hypothetical protein
MDIMQRSKGVALLGDFEILENNLGLSAVGEVAGQ